MATPPDADLDLGSDLLEGAEEIARFLFKKPEKRKRVYHLNELGLLPLFYMGGTLCGRKSTLTRYIADAERAAIKATTDTAVQSAGHEADVDANPR
ncbi:hypothetical protein HU675_0016210 [Bradyrhizobium septentrionale]|uniref:hypothetical protein n=1 Tax=Bradyrhizobium septentrionale TaxID=1404411 RepID=UPI0015970AF3|nr:hypothetical protein [Bradyrhizobium septentrionale]UGY28173.1 hypothetical protein HU675_0016210 [Bradyrhizobium septentrionale]